MKIDQETLQTTAQRHLMLANHFRADAPTQARFDCFRGPPVYPADPGLLELQNAVVLSGEWFVLAGGKAYCDAFVQSPFPPLSAYLARWTLDETVFVTEPPAPLPIQRGFLLGGCANYCHWLTDYLPRFEFYRSDCGTLLMNHPVQPFQTQSLAHLGVNMSEIMPLEYPRAYRVQTLFHPRTASTLCTNEISFRPAIVDWLRDKFKALRTPGGGQRKLFISRAGAEAHARRLLNDDEISGLAREQGFEIMRCEELSFEAQVKMFSEASIIAGAHGAGLTNLIFAPPTAKIVETMGPRLNCEQRTSLIFMKLASILGHKFVRVVGNSDERAPVFLNHPPFETYIIEPGEFLAAIQN
jgi:capsular polysaccharide biosynthesis protein